MPKNEKTVSLESLVCLLKFIIIISECCIIDQAFHFCGVCQFFLHARTFQQMFLKSFYSHEKASFNYLLMDPRVTLDLPQRNRKLSTTEAFRSFVLSVFYVGKGKRSRPYAHLHEAIKYSKTKVNLKEISSRAITILHSGPLLALFLSTVRR